MVHSRLREGPAGLMAAVEEHHPMAEEERPPQGEEEGSAVIELAIFLSTGALPKYEKSTNFTTCKFAENSQSRLRCQLSFVIRGYASAPRGYLPPCTLR